VVLLGRAEAQHIEGWRAGKPGGGGLVGAGRRSISVSQGSDAPYWRGAWLNPRQFCSLAATTGRAPPPPPPYFSAQVVGPFAGDEQPLGMAIPSFSFLLFETEHLDPNVCVRICVYMYYAL